MRKYSLKTRRGIAADYSGDNPKLCNVRTVSGRPCRALGLPGSGRCKWHGGRLPTAEEQAASKLARQQAREQARQRRLEIQHEKLRASAIAWVARFKKRRVPEVVDPTGAR